MGEAQVVETPPERWEWFSPSRGRTMILVAGVRPDPADPDDWTLLTDQPADGPAASASPDHPDTPPSIEQVDGNSPGA
jgi:hypothetical protein